MDLKSLDTIAAADRGAPLHLRHPSTDTPLMDETTGEPVSITLLGADSADFRRAEHAQQEKRIAKAQRSGRMAPGAGKQIEEDYIELLALATKSWQHIILDGVRLECNRETAKTLYTRFPWIREQVSTFIGSRSNYLGNS